MGTVLALSLAFLSGIFVSAAFPPWDLGGLAFIALVPLFRAIETSPKLISFTLGYLPGVLLAGSFFYPLVKIEGFPLSGYLVISFVCGIFYGLFALLYSLLSRWIGWPPIIIAPALWVAIEFLRANMSFLSNPGFLLGYTLHGYTSLIQIASLTSVYGLSFVIVLVNAQIAEVLRAVSHRRPDDVPAALKHPVIIRSVFVIVFTALILLFGLAELRGGDEKKDKHVKVALIQPNITREDRNDPDFKGLIMKRYSNLSEEAALDRPDLLVWPESSTPGHYPNDPWSHSQVSRIVKEIGIPLVLGSSTRDKTTKRKIPGIRFNNSAYLVNREDEITASYRKIRLVPFWEYLPLEDSFRWPRWLVPEHGSTLPGKEASLFQSDGLVFGAVICWEVLYPDLFRRFTKQGPDFMLNLSNESVFGWTSAPYKVQAMAVFRAVEGRKSLLRCNLTGMTSHIDPYGREKDRVTDARGNDLMVRGVITADVPVLNKRTFYTSYGDVFACMCVVWSLMMLLYATVGRISKRNRTGSTDRTAP